MNKFLLLFSILSIFMFTGCTRTSAFDYFATDDYYEKALPNMIKASLMKDLETKALLHGVYLNNVDKELYNDGEYFFIALHIIDDSKDPKQRGLYNPTYHLNMKVDLSADIDKDDINTEDKRLELKACKEHLEFKEEERERLETARFIKLYKGFSNENTSSQDIDYEDNITVIDNNTTKQPFPCIKNFQALNIQDLEKGHKLRLDMPVRNRWNEYYLVKFEKVEQEKLSLIFESDQYGLAGLNFLKEE
ncbi:MAG TPA: hypothetical protein EYO73_03030 [Sulfurimonas sp.]|nr:hypothetical protein [Sulfurimonas sp.]